MVMTPSSPTFSKASASILPTSLSLLAEMAATEAFSSRVLTFLACALIEATAASTAASTPLRRAIVFTPVAR